MTSYIFRSGSVIFAVRATFAMILLKSLMLVIMVMDAKLHLPYLLLLLFLLLSNGFFLKDFAIH